MQARDGSTDAPSADRAVTLVFGDLVGYSAATETHGDETAAVLALRLADLAEAACSPDAGDRLVKSIGDAVLCTASEPANGLRLAARLTEFVLGEPNFPELRTGLCHGPVVDRRGDVFGAAVNLASRIAEAAEPGEVLATAEIADVAVAMGIATTRLGPRRLKNLQAPHELFILELHTEQAAVTKAIDPVCRMVVDPSASPSWTDAGGGGHWFCSERCRQIFRHRSMG
jgi:class 3 adenylate cyclase